MITRKAYMADSANLHHAYYLEIAMASLPLNIPCSVEQVREALASGDEHLNTIPLGKWDAMALTGDNRRMYKALKERGDFQSLGTGVCVLKAYAKHLASL
jgi:hypothetical protein